MQGGIAILQYPGEVVTIRPYCPTVIFAPRTNAAVTLHTQDLEDLPSKLEYLDLSVSRIGACQWILGFPEQMNSVIEHKLVELYTYLDDSLMVEEKGRVNEEFLSALCSAWKKYGVHYREMLEQYLRQPDREFYVKDAPRIWRKVKDRWNLEGCPVCGEAIEDENVTFIEHFWRKHWGRGDEDLDGMD